MEIKAKTRQQLAEEFGVCPRTLKKWLREYDVELPSGLLSPQQVERVYEKCGVPEHDKTRRNRLKDLKI